MTRVLWLRRAGPEKQKPFRTGGRARVSALASREWTRVNPSGQLSSGRAGAFGSRRVSACSFLSSRVGATRERRARQHRVGVQRVLLQRIGESHSFAPAGEAELLLDAQRRGVVLERAAVDRVVGNCRKHVAKE